MICAVLGVFAAYGVRRISGGGLFPRRRENPVPLILAAIATDTRPVCRASDADVDSVVWRRAKTGSIGAWSFGCVVVVGWADPPHDQGSDEQTVGEGMCNS